MRADLHHEVLTRLKADYGLKEEGTYLRKGKCPQCDKRELWTGAKKPWVVRCGRIERCGYEGHVKELYPEIFDDWSKRHQQTPAAPNAAADAYLLHGRGFDLAPLRGSYSQERYHDHPHVEKFWESFDYIRSRETGDGTSIDHSRTADVHAISMPHFESKCADYRLSLPCAMNELKRLLRTSKSRKFIAANHSVNSVSGKIVSCWTFRNPHHGASK